MINQSNIIFILGLFSLGFTAYNYLRNPQLKLDKRQAVSETEVDGKAKLLAQQFQWDKETNEKKFLEINQRIADAFTLAQNHTHSVELKVDKLIETTNVWHLDISNKITELSTVVNERMPKKT